MAPQSRLASDNFGKHAHFSDGVTMYGPPLPRGPSLLSLLVTTTCHQRCLHGGRGKAELFTLHCPCLWERGGREGGRDGENDGICERREGGRNREGEGALPFIQQEKKAPPLPLPCTVPRTFLFY